MKIRLYPLLFAFSILAVSCGKNDSLKYQTSAITEKDVLEFKNPKKENYPETWFHFIGGNVAKAGITADLEAIASAKISGIQFFHGKFGGEWPKVEEQIQCLSPRWEEFLTFTADECKRLGLNFTMQNCPGWAMSGGPWITPEKAQRALVYSRTDTNKAIDKVLPIPRTTNARPQMKPNEQQRDYKDIAVLAFPTPEGDSGVPLKVNPLSYNKNAKWDRIFAGKNMMLPEVKKGNCNWVEVELPKNTVLRTLELPSVQSMGRPWCYDSKVKVKVIGITKDGKGRILADLTTPNSTWQDIAPLSIACNEFVDCTKIRVEISNPYKILLNYMKFYSSARKHNYESDAGWVLRKIERSADNVQQSKKAYINGSEILDISKYMSADGRLQWTPPTSQTWTILRIGHINKGMINKPAPEEATGWECDKLSPEGADAHFAGYIGKLANGALKGKNLKRLLLDSWECRTQTWTANMEAYFKAHTGYDVRKWLPAVFGYVVDDVETTTKFLYDWRSNIGSLYSKNFFGRMVELAKKQNLEVLYETAAGDVFPADIMEYFKYSDTPMCEFWQPITESFVGSLNFKPIKPTASAARLYGKKRVAAEAFTCMNLSWDDHWQALREVANVNMIEGVSYIVFHTYTHNPQVNFLKPGTSFGHSIGTPFLRGQTWWHLMPEFTTYFARTTQMLERGKSVSDILWYLGDEQNHKPDQLYPFPKGFKYDYCNPDVLLNRLSVCNGELITPEGLTYKALWLNDNKRMRVDTLEKILQLVEEGATVIGNAPQDIATLKGGKKAKERFDYLVKKIWAKRGENKIGKGRVISETPLDVAIATLKYKPRVVAEKLPMWLCRKTQNADIFFVASPQDTSYKGDVKFLSSYKNAEIWNAITGEVEGVVSNRTGDYMSVNLGLAKAESVFVVFRDDAKKTLPAKVLKEKIDLKSDWNLAFPDGWGTPKMLKLNSLKAWKDLPMSDEGKAFSGTATYTKSFNLKTVNKNADYILNLGKVDMAAKVFLNGKELAVVWCEPFEVKLNNALKQGDNELKIEITSTWFNRLAYDANLPEAQRKTWTIAGPKPNSALRESGLLGDVIINILQ